MLPKSEPLEEMLKRLHLKYNSVNAALTMDPEVRQDVALLLRECVNLLRDIAGARQTLIALCKMAPGGVIEVPYTTVADIKPTDRLVATEEVVFGLGGDPTKVKRFRVGGAVVTAMPKVN
jgi:hypothetical protein